MSAPIACQLLTWLRSNRAWLYRMLPPTPRPSDAALRDTINQLASFERYYRGAQCWLRGTLPVDSAPVPGGYFSRADKMALRLMALLATHDLSKPPVWASLHALPGLKQHDFQTFLRIYVGYHALPRKIAPVANRGVRATWSLASGKGVLAIGQWQGLALARLTYTFVAPVALPTFGEQMQQARDYWNGIDVAVDEFVALHRDGPGSPAADQGQRDTVRQLVNHWLDGLSPPQRELLRKHSGVVASALTE